MPDATTRLATAVAWVAIVTTTPAYAGSATIDAGGGNRVTFEYSDSMLRINNSIDPNSYAVVRDSTMYTVAVTQGIPMVMDAGAMMKSMGNMPGMDNMTPPAATGDLDGRVVALKDTGDDETIAGIRGDVYELTIEESSGQQRTETLVLSSDARVLEFRDAMLMMVDITARLAPNHNLDNALEQGEELEKRLRSMNAGVLRFGDEMRIAEIDGEAVAATRFELPAKPMDLQGFGNMLGEMQKRMQQR